jgi:hypothetical protein
MEALVTLQSLRDELRSGPLKTLQSLRDDEMLSKR